MPGSALTGQRIPAMPLSSLIYGQHDAFRRSLLSERLSVLHLLAQQVAV
jgi:hypothetical protein